MIFLICILIYIRRLLFVERSRVADSNNNKDKVEESDHEIFTIMKLRFQIKN